MRSSTLVLALLSLAVIVSGHTNTVQQDDSTVSLSAFLLIILVIAVVVVAFFVFLYKFQTAPGVLPLRKMAIIAALTLVINAIIFGILYVEV